MQSGCWLYTPIYVCIFPSRASPFELAAFKLALVIMMESVVNFYSLMWSYFLRVGNLLFEFREKTKSGLQPEMGSRAIS